MPKALFVSERFLKDHTAISGNVDAKELLPFVEEAQDQFVQSLTGSKLYEQLLDSVFNSSTTADEDTLLELIRTALSWFCVYKALPFVNWKFRNRSIQGGGGSTYTEDGTPADLTVLKYLRDESRTNAEFHAQRVVDYLCSNMSKYPNYTKVQSGDVAPQGSGYRLNIAFDISQMSDEEKECYRRWC